MGKLTISMAIFHSYVMYIKFTDGISTLHYISKWMNIPFTFHSIHIPFINIAFTFHSHGTIPLTGIDLMSHAIKILAYDSSILAFLLGVH